MELAALVPLALKVSIAMTVVSLGLEARPSDVLDLLRRPGLMARSVLALNVLMPVVAVGMTMAWDLHPAVQIAVVALALSPVPPMLPRNQLKVGGSSRYVYGLLVTAGLGAVVIVPLGLDLVERFYGRSLHVAPSSIATIIITGVLAPLAAGMAIRAAAPDLAGRVARPLATASTVLLALAALAVIAKAGPAMVSLLGDGALRAFGAFIAVGLAAGFLLGGPDPDDRDVLALATASRHPGIALAIAGGNFPDQTLAMPAVLTYLLLCAALTAPYLRWRRPEMATTV